MIIVLRIDGLVDNVKPGEIRRFFKENGSRPEDIHITYPDGSRGDGIALLIFTKQRDADIGAQADGATFKGRRITVKQSNPIDFNRLFPGKPMVTRQRQNAPPPPVSDRGAGVVKVEGLENRTTAGEIRKLFRDKGARAEDIHIVQAKERNRHTGVAFVIFSSQREVDIALSFHGFVFKDHKIMTRLSSFAEFNKYFPGQSMVSQGANNPAGPLFKGVIKVSGLDLDSRPGDIRRYFREVGARPADIHLIRGPSGRHDGSALLAFTEKGDMDAALQADGTYFRDQKISIRLSSPKEFNRNFPGVDMITRMPKSSVPERGGREPRSEYGDIRRGNDRPRDRSRSPLRGKQTENDQHIRRDGRPAADPFAGVDEGKFVKMSGLPYDVGTSQIVTYFNPVPIRDIHILKHVNGKYAGQATGGAVVEFFARNNARKAVLEFNGRYIGQRMISVRYASREDIGMALRMPLPDAGLTSFPVNVDDNQAGNGNPQLQNLLTLLTATVSAIANQNTQSMSSNSSLPRLERNDSVVSRVASSADIDVTDIKRGCVVGIRNLPYSVVPDQILKFFHGFHVIADSVRIHYLDDGRCSGDAIVTFRDNRDARNAVSALNRKTLGHRRVELFFL